MQRAVSFTLNGKPVRLDVDDSRMLLYVLRYDLGLTGTKYGCGAALCGACTVLIDGEPAQSCATTMKEVEGRKVVTIEGLARGESLHPIQQAFLDHHAFQCGFCTPGMILGAHALLSKKPNPTADEVKDALEGHLCRCGSHVRVVEAVRRAAVSAKGGVR